MDARRHRLAACLDHLYATYGREEPQPEGDVLSTLVRDLLSQATSRANSARAYRQLVDAFGGDWDAVRRARLDDVVSLIAIGGLSRQKAPRLLALLERAYTDFGRCSLEALRDWDVPRALAYLKALDGVGPKTAAFTLMRAAGRDVFPLNSGILRVLRRLALVGESDTDAAAHALMAGLVPDGEAHAAHVAFVRHARQVCVARRPRCVSCALEDVCPRVGVGEA